MFRQNYLIHCLSLLLLFSCNSVNVEQEKEKIIAVMEDISAAHFEKDAAKFYKHNASEWVDVRNGGVSTRVKQNAIGGTQDYLDNMEFIELSQSHDPIVEIADDGSMASYIGAVHVKGRYGGQPIFWVVSWQSILKNKNGHWQITQTANTELPESQTGQVIVYKSSAYLEKEKKVADISSIYTKAKGKGPTGNFSTILISDMANSRFEQKGEKYHSILGVEKTKSWFFDPESQKQSEGLDTLTQLFVNGHELHWLSLHPNSRFQNPLFKQYVEFENEMAFEVEFTDKLNRPVVFYYRFKDYQPLGFVMYTGAIETEETVRVSFDGWKNIDGIMTFTKAKFKQGDQIFDYDFETIEWNQVASTQFSSKTKLL